MAMSDTPRTDAAWEVIEDWENAAIRFRNLSRALEREMNYLLKRLNKFYIKTDLTCEKCQKHRTDVCPHRGVWRKKDGTTMHFVPEKTAPACVAFELIPNKEEKANG